MIVVFLFYAGLIFLTFALLAATSDWLADRLAPQATDAMARGTRKGRLVPALSGGACYREAQGQATQSSSDDEDLAWVDEQIARAEEGRMGEPEVNEDMQAQRRAYLDRLYRVRERLSGQ